MLSVKAAMRFYAEKFAEGGGTLSAENVVADDAWERLLKIRERLRKDVASHDKVTERIEKIGEEIGKGWQSEKSAVEILSEMRR